MPEGSAVTSQLFYARSDSEVEPAAVQHRRLGRSTSIGRDARWNSEDTRGRATAAEGESVTLMEHHRLRPVIADPRHAWPGKEVARKFRFRTRC